MIDYGHETPVDWDSETGETLSLNGDAAAEYERQAEHARRVAGELAALRVRDAASSTANQCSFSSPSRMGHPARRSSKCHPCWLVSVLTREHSRCPAR